MKLFLSVCAIALTSFVMHAQVDFYIQGQQVDQSQVYQFSSNQADDQLVIEFENATADTMVLTGDACVLSDSPSWEFAYVVWAKSNEPLNEIGFVVDLDSSMCWRMVSVNATRKTLLASERASFGSYFEISGTGCETIRYYAVEDGVALDSVDVQYCSVLGLKQLDQEAIKVFPNPSSNHFQVEFPTSNSFDVKMFSLTGSQVKSVQGVQNDAQINAQDLKNGMYFIEVFQDGEVQARRKIQIAH